MTTRTIAARVLMARAREHGRALTTLGDSAEWAGMAWADVVADPECLYHEAARDACTAAAGRFLTGSAARRDTEVDELDQSRAARGVVDLRAVRLLGRGAGGASAARIGLGWLGGGRRRHSTSANR